MNKLIFLLTVVSLFSCSFSQTGIKKQKDELTGTESNSLVIDLRSPGHTEWIYLSMSRASDSEEIKSALLRVKHFDLTKIANHGALKVKAGEKIYSFNSISPDRKYNYARETEINPQGLKVWREISQADEVTFQGNGLNAQVTMKLGKEELNALKEFVK